MASLIQMSEAIESGKIRISDETASLNTENGAFNHSNPADWLHKRAASTNEDYVSLLRKCE